MATFRKALMGVSIPFCLGFLIMGFTYFGRHKGMLYFGRLLSGTMNGAATPASQIYVMRWKMTQFYIEF